MLFFRVQRELAVQDRGEPNWIPYADWLLLFASWMSLLLVIVPLLILDPTKTLYRVLPSASCVGACILIAGYPLAILAHYRFLFGRRRTGPRENPEPAENWIVRGSFALALTASLSTAWIRLT